MGESEANHDCWSLLAVVRECSAKSNSKPPIDTSKPTPTPTPVPYHAGGGSMQNDCMEPPGPATALAVADDIWFDELIDLYKPFMMRCSTLSEDVTSPPASPSDRHARRGAFLATSMKKNKNEEKRVCMVSTEELSSDKWSWRKYGQKPIKGSPYPRNYYRCSSLKGCTARKQVEQSPIDPNTYIVTYTGQHHHSIPPPRNPLGSRVKPSVTRPIGNPNSLHTGSSTPDRADFY